MDFFERQDRAKDSTKILSLYFVMAVLLTLVGVNMVFATVIGSGQTFNPITSTYWATHYFTIVSLSTIGFIVLGNLIVYFDIRGGGSIIAEQVGASPVNMNSPDSTIKQFINIVEEMSIASGVIVPALYVMEYEDSINAFVAGLKEDNTVLVVTQGALNNLDRDALQGIVGHEFSHILHQDMRINLKLIGTVTGISMIGELGYAAVSSLFSDHRGYGYTHRNRHHRRYRNPGKSLFNSSSDSGNSFLRPYAIIGLGLLIVGYIGLFFGRLIKATISRQREYLADASAVQFTRNKDGIAKALTTILYHQNGSFLETAKAERVSHMCFGESLKFSSMFATHPPLEDRIKAISPSYLVQYKIKKRNERTDKRKEETGASSSGKTTHYSSSNYISSFSNHDQTVNVSRSDIMACVGSPQPEHLDVAHDLLAVIPDLLHLAAYSESSARAVIYAMILASTKDKQKISYTAIEKYESIEISENTRKFSELMQRGNNAIRLPLIELCFPTLKKLDDGTKSLFLKLCMRLCSLDKKISSFEFILITIIRAELTAPTETLTEYNKIKPVLASIERVLTLLVYIGKNKEPEEVFSSFMSKFRHTGLDILPISECKHNRLSNDLIELSRLNAKIKKTVLNAFIGCIVHDDVVMPEEAELIRAISMVMGCPMPPLIANNIH